MPSLDLLRQLTSRHVFEQLLANDSLTRAQISARTGISKPTISHGVQRLLEAGVIVESGRQVGKRGPAGMYLSLNTEAAFALAVSAGPGHIETRTLDLRSRVIGRAAREIPISLAAGQLGPILREMIAEAARNVDGPIRGCGISVAAPVERPTGDLITLPHAPFVIDELSTGELLRDLPVHPVTVDNDVNWAALAELGGGSAEQLSDFVLCYLGAGIGAAAVAASRLLHGGRGLAGELAHVLTVGPGGRAMPLGQCFAAWGLLHSPSAAIDVDRVRRILAGTTAADRKQRDGIAAGVAGALGSVAALFNPDAIVVAGPWGASPGFVGLVADRLPSTLSAELRTATFGDDAAICGASICAVHTARSQLAETW